ncbi:MAG: hypothetical protein WAT19_02410 [Ferruginibacter sp.]
MIKQPYTYLRIPAIARTAALLKRKIIYFYNLIMLNLRICILSLVACSISCLSSCTAFRPLKLYQAQYEDSIQPIGPAAISKFNGDYQAISSDSGSITLAYAFTYEEKCFNSKLPGKDDFVRLQVLDERHIKASLFVKGGLLISKTVKGKFTGNSFKFSSSHFRIRLLLNVHRQQTNRISISANGDLLLDTNSGAIGYLLMLPVPLSGSATDTYNLKFKRRD